MSTCTVKLYKVDFTPEMNARVDNLSHYLLIGQRLILTLNNFQYQQIELNMQLKAVVAERYVGEKYANYLSIYQDGKTYYYFIVGTEWTGQTTVKFNLAMDTINTFADLTFTEKTHVIREHKDRIKPYRYWTWAPVFAATLVNGNEYKIQLPSVPTSAIHEVIDSVTANSQAKWILPNGKIKYDSGENVRIKISIDMNYNNVLHAPTSFDLSIKAYNAGGTLLSSWETHSLFDLIHFADSDYFLTFKYTSSTTMSAVGRTFFVSGKGEVYDAANPIGRRIIDKQSEGLTPVLFGKDKGELIKSGEDDDNWYLIYHATAALEGNKSVPVSAYLASDSQQQAELLVDGCVIEATDLTAGKWYYVTLGLKGDNNCFPGLIKDINCNQEVQFEVWTGTDVISSNLKMEEVKEEKGIYRQYILEFKLGSDNKIEWVRRKTNRGNDSIKKTARGEGADKIVFKASDMYYYQTDSQYLTYTNINNDSTIINITATTQTIQTSAFSELDRSKAQLMKIIQLPYCPVFNIYNYKANTVEGCTFLKLDTKGAEKGFNTVLKLDAPYHYNNDLYVTINKTAQGALDLTALRNDKYESKLYHSDFYQPKFVYDSFAFTFQLEQLNQVEDVIDEEDNSYKNEMDFEYAVSNNSSSKMAFRFTEYEPSELTQFYDNVLTIDRDNSVPIYNSNYLNYLQLGYNAEVKEKNANLTKNIVTGVISTVGGIASLVFGEKTSGAALTTAGVGLLIGAAAKTASAAIQYADAERALQTKQEQLKQEGSSISGSDDLSIFNWYSNNRAKMMTWEVSDHMRKLLADVFYYTGYTCDEQKIPNLNSRVWFNFIQCEPVFTESSNLTYYEFIEDVKAKYQAGVTVFHEVNGNQWDFQQVKENWETSLL